MCRLKYDEDTRSFQNNTNVRIIVPGFGETSSVEYLSPNFILAKFKDFRYFDRLVEYFVYHGYKRGKTIRAAPYDWRLAAGMSIVFSVCGIHVDDSNYYGKGLLLYTDFAQCHACPLKTGVNHYTANKIHGIASASQNRIC